MKVSLKKGNISDVPQEEIQGYMDYARKKYPDEIIDEIIIDIGDDGYVGLEIHKHAIPFLRIRRITGYLVGTLDRFNNGKKAEERDRVKHGIDDPKGVY